MNTHRHPQYGPCYIMRWLTTYSVQVKIDDGSAIVPYTSLVREQN